MTSDLISRHRVSGRRPSFAAYAFASTTLCTFSAIALAGAGSVVPQAKSGQPVQGLTAAQLQRFFDGRNDYTHVLNEGEGLGPCFNKESCGNCHANPLGGPGSQTVTRFGLAGKGGFDPLAELGGSLLQAVAINPACQEVIPDDSNVQSFRVTNGAMGYGLIEAIPDAALLANRDAQPPELQGIAHMVTAFEDPVPPPPQMPILHVGRFGWKAQVPTMLTFSADAALNEMGLTNRFVTQENAPNGNLALLAQFDQVADPEDGPDSEGLHFIDRVATFQRYLTQPPQTPRSGMSGEVIFNAIGCAVCHTPSFTTSNDLDLEPALRNKAIRPYSDFLLHDMANNGDFIVQGAGTEQLLKTPPLWGLRTRDPLWHDGRVAGDTFANRMAAVIALHDDQTDVVGQGEAAAQAFANLSVENKAKVIAFLDSLGRIEFDADGDNDVRFDDFAAFHACYGISGINADHACAISDIDQDGDIDVGDFGSFLIAWEGLRRDCNNNGIIDLRDILDGAADADNNAIPDSCEPTCDQDTNGNGQVEMDDLIEVILGWGECPALPAPCPGDLTANYAVDVDDLVEVILAWGGCP
jgi:hypothetical protein